MDARIARLVVLTAAMTSLGASHRTENFVVEAPTASFARQVGQAAEKYRKDLALEWLGRELPAWDQPCPIQVQVGPQLGAGGATSFNFDRGRVFGWRMTIQGSQERVLDSVLPHEITHTVFASHFRQPLPRWADEGACTTVEHRSERAKQQHMLIEFLKTGRGISFSRMFAMKDYPRDVMPLYAQGYSLSKYLIYHHGKRHFINFVAAGLRDENWTGVTNEYYGYANLAALQESWLDWVRQGSPPMQQMQPDSRTPAIWASQPGRADAAQLASAGESNTATAGERELVPVTGTGRTAGADAGGYTDRPTQLAEDTAASPKGWTRAGSRYLNPPAHNSNGGSNGSLAQGTEAPSDPSAAVRPGPEGSLFTSTVGEADAPAQTEPPAPTTANQYARPQGIQQPTQRVIEWANPQRAAVPASRYLQPRPQGRPMAMDAPLGRGPVRR